MFSLQVQPEFGSHVQSLANGQGRILGNGPAAVNSVMEVHLGHFHRFRQAILGDGQIHAVPVAVLLDG